MHCTVIRQSFLRAKVLTPRDKGEGTVDMRYSVDPTLLGSTAILSWCIKTAPPALALKQINVTWAAEYQRQPMQTFQPT